MRIAGGTAKRIIKRIINFILVIWGVVTLSFCLQVFTGTDPAEMIVRKVNVFATEEQIQAVREELGLDAPFLERYTDYIKGVLTGDLGTAITNRQPVIENIKDALPVTCMLVVMAMAWVIIFTVLIAAISVIRKGGIFDNVMRIICIIGICVPSFWLALILLTAFAVQIPIFSVISDGSFKSLILPSVAMAVPTPTGENGNLLSGGERQRISIARAILKNSPILLLDEATASLDIENELAVKQAIANLLKEKKTVVMIAHTLSIVKNADQILVVADGKIAEAGTHEELLAKNGKYAAMWQAEQKISA